MTYVYIIRNELDGIYIGSTNDLRRRFAEHNAGRSTYTRGHQWHLLYNEAYLDDHDARLREMRLKQQGQAMAQLKRRISGSLRSKS